MSETPKQAPCPDCGKMNDARRDPRGVAIATCIAPEEPEARKKWIEQHGVTDEAR